MWPNYVFGGLPTSPSPKPTEGKLKVKTSELTLLS